MFGINYERSVDLIGLSGVASADRSVVNSFTWMSQLQLNYKIGQSSIGLKGMVIGLMSVAIVTTLMRLMLPISIMV